MGTKGALADVVADAVPFLPLVFVSSASPIAVVLFALLAGWSELCGVLPKAAGFTRRYDGPLAKSDRALAVGPYLVAVAVALIVVRQPKGFVAPASRIHWGLMSFVFGLSHAALLLKLPELDGFAAGPRGLFLEAVGAGILLLVFGFFGDLAVG